MKTSQDFKIRASASGDMLPNARAKGEVLSQTTKTYLDRWIKENVYGTTYEFSSKYTSKGIAMEDVAISKAIEWMDLPFALKNEKHFEDDNFTGTPDLVLPDKIIDIKCSYDCFTFPLLDDVLSNRDYIAQVNVYMHLAKLENAQVVYVLLNTPDEIEPWKPKHDYNHIDPKFRIKAFDVKYDPEIINELIYKVKESRKYIDEKLEYIKIKL